MKLKHTLWIVAICMVVVAPAWGQGTFFVEGDNVGIGVSNPADVLHIVRPSGEAIVRVITAGAAMDGDQAGFRFATDAGAKRWDVRIGGVGNLIYNYNGGTVESTYHTNGDLTILGSLFEGSSRDVKHDVRPVDPREILAKVMQVPVSTWRYDASPEVRHVGPMAEDFYSAFDVGSEATTISTIDRDGVALAAIQGLKVEKDAELETLRQENERLRAEIKEIRELVQSLRNQG